MSQLAQLSHLSFLVALSLASLSCGNPVDGHSGMQRSTDDGHFLVRAEPRTKPIPLHEMHEWILHVETKSGLAVESARISIDGGMPEHQHGLPTVPAMTRSLGEGDFLIEGLKFSMPGLWTLTFDIEAGDRRDSVTFEIQL